MRPQSELREVRPYAGVDDIQDALSDLKLEFGDAVVEQAGRTTVSGRAYLRDRVGLRVAHDDEAEIFVKRLTAAVEQADLEAATVRAGRCCLNKSPQDFRRCLAIKDLRARRPWTRR